MANIDDNLDNVWSKFLHKRKEDLFHKYTGWYRAIVVDTNDPLRMHRIRFKIPELHNNDSKSEDLPWAAPAFSFGGHGAGAWSHPCIGDIVWIVFEKGHPYSPIWTGAADATRR